MARGRRRGRSSCCARAIAEIFDRVEREPKLRAARYRRDQARVAP
jgi:hypothetical protein